MELGADQAQILDRSVNLLDRPFTLQRIDTCEAHKLAWVFPHNRCEFIMCEMRQARSCLGVPGEQHSDNVPLRILPGYFIHFADRDPAPKELFRRSDEWLDRAIQETGGRQVDMHVNCLRHLSCACRIADGSCKEVRRGRRVWIVW